MVVGNKFDLVVDSPNYTQVLRSAYPSGRKIMEINLLVYLEKKNEKSIRRNLEENLFSSVKYSLLGFPSKPIKRILKIKFSMHD